MDAKQKEEIAHLRMQGMTYEQVGKTASIISKYRKIILSKKSVRRTETNCL